MVEKCDWPLGNGGYLQFDIYTQNTRWNSVGGLYVFTYQRGDNWIAVYVGETDDFGLRIPNHERLTEAGQLGATHIHALVVSQEIERKRFERVLIQHLQPTLNIQHRRVAS